MSDLQTKPFDMDALAELQKSLVAVSRNHVTTMNYYASTDGKGFWHQPRKRSKASLSSTATCVSSLTRAGIWHHKDRQWGESQIVAERLLATPWKSAGLKKNNPFGLSFIAEGVLDIIDAGHYPGAEVHDATVRLQIVPRLVKAITSGSGYLNVAGAVRIAPYPPSAYLTQLAFRVVQRCHPSSNGHLRQVTAQVRTWARQEMQRQIVLIETKSRIADPMQLAYAIVLACSAATDEHLSPEEKALISSALQTFFNQQQNDGSWPPSQPLFHYPDVGNAQCFEYEVLTQMLTCAPLQDELLRYLDKFTAAVAKLNVTSFHLASGVESAAIGWASGHHPQIEGPESWSTACVYDFVHALGRLTAEAIRRSLFAEINHEYLPPESEVKEGLEYFAPQFLDSEINDNGTRRSLRKTLWERFVSPIQKERDAVAHGGQLSRDTPMSAILFGPPGTSKTELAKAIGKYLGWPLLSVDPSYVVQDGIERLYARANKLFAMLVMAERVVVLLDEFDEMGRDRAGNTDLLSRFITTSMLPKLAAINKQRRIVFLLATNFVSQFDAAFSRGERFDMVAQVMPPTYDAKMGNKDWKQHLEAFIDALPSQEARLQAEEALADLTFLETKEIVPNLAGPPLKALARLRKACANGTLAKTNGNPNGKKTPTWKATCKSDEAAIRIPPLPTASTAKQTLPN